MHRSNKSFLKWGAAVLVLSNAFIWEGVLGLAMMMRTHRVVGLWLPAGKVVICLTGCRPHSGVWFEKRCRLHDLDGLGRGGTGDLADSATQGLPTDQHRHERVRWLGIRCKTPAH